MKNLLVLCLACAFSFTGCNKQHEEETQSEIEEFNIGPNPGD
ncbi:MAG: hypothetical protein K940chlam9_01313 [Chlamydiae bacterium]|nr:hypothetical protein [Chlamydiota bacterium]